MRNTLYSVAFLGFFSLPLSALEENIIGTWMSSGVAENAEGEVSWTFRVDIQTGTFEVSYFTELDYNLRPEWTVNDKGFRELLEQSWPSLNAISFQGIGTYVIDGDSLWMYFDEIDWRYNEAPIIEFYAKFIGKLAFGTEDLTVEEILALERESGNEFLVRFEQGNLFEIANAIHRYTYTVEGETLFLSGHNREKSFLRDPAMAKSIELHRIDAASVVTSTSWGGLKATLAPADVGVPARRVTGR